MAECRADGCDRRTASRGWCSSHYRRWRSGALDAPIRGYERFVEAEDGSCVGVESYQSATQQGHGEKPFAAETQLLRELGLR